MLGLVLVSLASHSPLLNPERLSLFTWIFNNFPWVDEPSTALKTASSSRGLVD